MANTLRIKRRASGSPGAPASLQNAELAYNEVDDTLYYGKGTGGLGGSATSVEAIGGPGAFVNKAGAQTISGDKTFTGAVVVQTPTAGGHAVTKDYADALSPNLTPGSGISITGTTTKTIAADATIARVDSPTFTGTPSAPTPATATNTTQIATTAFVKAQGYLTTAPVTSVAGRTGAVTLTKADVGLSNVDNTSDASKPVSTAQQTALDAKAPLSSPALTGTPTAPTALASTNTTQIATTAFVKAQGYLTTAPVTSVAGRTGAVTLGVADVSGAAPLASPTFTGVPAAPTAATITNSTQIATTAFVQAVVASLVGAAPGVLDTLAEIATALGNDPNFATTITTELAAKLVKANNLSDLTDAAAARTNLGLGTMATQAASNVAITGGAIDGITLDGGTF